MRPSGYDDGSRRDFERSRMSSGGYFGASSRPYGGEYDRGYGGGYGAGYGGGYEGGYGGGFGCGYGGGPSYGNGGGSYSRRNDYYRNGRSQSVPGRYDDRYYYGDLNNRGYYSDQYDQRRRNQSGGNRFESYQSPERFGFSRNSRMLSGPGYSRAYNDSGFDGRQRDRFQDPYYDQQRSYGSYGQRYASDRNFSQERMDRFGSGYDRYGQSFGYGQNQIRGNTRFGSPSRRSLYDYDQSNYGRNGRSSSYGRNASGSGRFPSGNYDRYRLSVRFGKGNYSDSEWHGNGFNDQYANRGYGFQQSRFGYPERRSYPSSDRFNQGSRVRFGGERDDYRRRHFSADRARRPSVSDNYQRREYGRSDDRHDFNFGRRYNEGAGFSRESQYQTDGMSNMNRKFEAFPGERMQRNIRGGRSSSMGGSSERRFDMQGGNDYQGGGQYGTQASNDRMPPPIPPFTEPRSNYPNTMALTWYEDSDRFNQNSSNRCRELAVRASYDLMRRRYYENAADPSQNPTWLQRGGFGNAYNMSTISPDVLRIDFVDFYPVDNAKENRTYDYEMVRDQEQPNPVLRRGESFRMSMLFRDREFDSERDKIFLNFYFGPSPSVPKRTRIVLPVTVDTGKEFERAPHQWDCRFQGQEGNKITFEVFVPATCPVGMWRCVVETALRDSQSSRLQYRCPEDIYLIFNPFCRNDTVWIENDAQRFEYTMNDNGKVYTGGYRNVRGRPWIYGQFDDCVLPAACLLLEMSGLPHSERGNSVKVARALASMIKATKNQRGGFNSFFDSSSKFGLVETKYEDDFRGGNTPHLWTGSVQIIEEFLRGGATPVKYAQCWVISALMTTLCRALGLPSRPVTAYVSAMETQDSLTVDRYVDRFGDVIEQGPAQDQPDSIWSFHTWSDVWMNRPDLPQVYSGWQATDPCRTFRDFRDLFSGSCGPCPVEALRRGDVGQRDDVDAFYSSLNAYVRYFYEDDESGWGYSPFRQFRYPMSRYILTKAVGRYDEEGDNDCDDLTNVYRDNERSDAERFGIFNSCRGFLNMPPFEYQAAAYNWGPFNPTETDQSNFDVSFELDAPEQVMIGQAMTVPVVITNSSPEPRNIQTNICTRSCFYTGVCGPYLKRSSTQMILAPNQTETITLTLDPWDYQEKLVDMSFIKITVTSFVQETGQSFIDEFDFRFSKPRLDIDVGELRVGIENDATFSFVNPLDVPLTDCFLTMEVSGSVRPRTIRIAQEVGPREVFSYRQSFTPRFAGEHRMVACFASRQLQDVVGQRPVVVRGMQ